MTQTACSKLNVAASLARLIGLAILLALLLSPQPANAQWPPFKFRLIPSYDNGQITYQVRFSRQVEWPMADIALRIPLPQGTRFLEAGAPPTTQVVFDGQDVSFFTSVLSRPLNNAFFVVEVTDPAQTVFTTHAWIAWKGDQPGDFVAEEVSLDITEPDLPWQKPARSRVQLEAMATVAEEIITYAFYPTNVTSQRIWDVTVKVPLPQGTTFVSAEAPPPFVAGFDGQEVSFSAIELASQQAMGPLSFKVSASGVTAPSLVTQAVASWKNVGRKVGHSIPAQEETRTGDIVVQPGVVQQVVADAAGDVAFARYDLTSLALQPEETALKASFYTAGPIGAVGEPLQYVLYLDSDCQANTGALKKGYGVEYRVRYRHDKGQADLHRWQAAPGAEADAEVETTGGWKKVGPLEDVSAPADGQVITVAVPFDLLALDQQFCWLGETKFTTRAYTTNPPKDWLPDGTNLNLTQFEVLSATSEALTSQ